MFAYVLNNIVQFLIQPGVEFTIDGVTYPGNWIQLSSTSEQQSLGIYEVVYGQRPNDTYYWVTQEAPVFANNQVQINFTSTPKDLTSVKSNAFNQINATAYSLLFPSDWMVVKAFETSTPINADWNTYRANLRATADNARTMVTQAPDVETVAGIMANINWGKSPAQLLAEAAQGANNGN